MAKQKKGQKAADKPAEKPSAKNAEPVAGAGLRELLRVPAGEVDLTKLDTRSTAGFTGSKDDGKVALESLGAEVFRFVSVQGRQVKLPSVASGEAGEAPECRSAPQPGQHHPGADRRQRQQGRTGPDDGRRRDVDRPG